jgi:NADH-quinone oxidoreductase subunit L
VHSILFIVFLPLIAAAIAGLGNKSIGFVPAKVVTTGALFISCALSWPIFIGYLMGTSGPEVTPVLHFIHSGTMDVAWALRVDALTAVMLVVVTSVSALVHLYSWGYMEEDPDQPRFFAYLSLFTFAMLMLVTANNLVQMFFGWEGVGLASYLLIGFWLGSRRPMPPRSRRSSSTASVTLASCSGFSAPIWCSTPYRSPKSWRLRRAWRVRRSVSLATATTR